MTKPCGEILVQLHEKPAIAGRETTNEEYKLYDKGKEVSAPVKTKREMTNRNLRFRRALLFFDRLNYTLDRRLKERGNARPKSTGPK